MNKKEAKNTSELTTEIAPAPKESGEKGLSAHKEVEAWGATEQLDSNDILVPKIYHQQAMSKFVAEEKAKPGDWADSVTGEVLCKKDGLLEIIIFGLYKTLVVEKFDFTSQKFELDKALRLTPQTALEYASKPFIEDIGEERFKNSLFYNFYCLLPANISGFPYVLSLGSTKAKAAKRLGLMLKKLEQNRHPSAYCVFQLKSVAEKNDKGSWYGVDITQGRDSTETELEIAKQWYLKSKIQTITAVETSADDESDEVPF